MILENLRTHLETAPYDAILLAGLENPKAFKNLYYVTKYTGSYGFAIVGKDFQYFLSDFRYRDQVKQEVPNFTFVEIEGSYLNAIKSVIEKENIKALGFDQKVRYSDYASYQTLGVLLLPMNDVIESLRVSKTEAEIALLKEACKITDDALAYVLKQPLVGQKESDIEILLKNKMIELGADSTWERFIVASGPRGAMPHGMASEKIIQEGELVTFDIGCFYKGYSSDLTRTVAIGIVNPKLLEIYQIVYDAQRKCVDAAKAGITGKELDAVARDYITEKGYGDYFKHGTGHGLGLDVHEHPRVSQANELPLELGACVTIEPGIYISGLGGVRIEDDVILTEDGCIVLNESPKELMILKP